MTESIPTPNSEIFLELPSKLRIKQRLGQVSRMNQFKEEIASPIIQLGGQHEPITSEQFTSRLFEILSEYPDGQSGVSELGYRQGVRVIGTLVVNDVDRLATIGEWHDKVCAQDLADHPV